MQDDLKSKEQLISELQDLRSQIAALKTECNHTEETLRESEERLHIITEATFEGIAIHDKGKIVEANQVLASMFGYTREELIGKHVLELAAPESRDMVFQNVLSGYEEPYEALGLRKDGSIIVGELRGKGIPYNGRILRVTAARDITDRKLAEEKLSKYNTELENLVAERTVNLTKLNEQLQAEISQRKRSEESLKETEEKLRILVENSAEGIGISKKGCIIFANEAMLKIFGYEKIEEFTRIPILEHLAPQSREKLLDVVEKRARGESVPPRYEYEIIRKDGRIVDLEISTIELVIENERCILGIFRDITEQKRAEDELRRSEEKWRSLVENAPNLIIIADRDGTILFMNKGVTGRRSIEDMRGKKIYDYMNPEDVPLVRKTIEQVFQTGNVGTYEIKAEGPDATLSWYLTHAGPIKHNGHVVAVTLIVTDITEHKKKEEALNIKDIAMASSVNGIALCDLQARITYVNRSFLNIWGYNSANEILGRSIGEFCLERENIENILDILYIKEKWTGESAVKRKDGSLINIQIIAKTVTDDNGDYICIMFSFLDITEKIRMEEEIRRTQTFESLGLLAGGIAHEFNNILLSILGNISLTKKYIESENNCLKMLCDAEQGCFRAADLTKKLLDFATSETPVKEIVGINSLINDTVELGLRGTNIRCRYILEKDPWTVEIDVGQISYVINNIILNARQSMPQGGIIVVRSENVFIDEQGNIPLNKGKYIRISIEDRGIGIPKEHLDKIFDPYFTTKQKGSGFGLAISFSIIKKHEGYIRAESEVGIGTKFHIYLPASDRKVPKPLREEEMKMIPGSGKILFMDDEQPIRHVAGIMLAELGYEVEFAKDGAEAIELYKRAITSNKNFKAVILDLTVQGNMGGREAAKKLLEIDPKVKCIISSGYSRDPVMSNFEEYGFCDAVFKPYSMKSLSNVLSRVILG